MFKVSVIKDKIQYFIISILFNGDYDLRVSNDLNAKDPDTIVPLWFRLTEKFPPLTLWCKARREERDYTLPIPKFLWGYVYGKSLPMSDRNRILTILQRSSGLTETVILLRLRRENCLDQHRKKQLYDIAKSNSANVYAEMYDAGFGFEFNLLASAYKAGKIEKTVADLKQKLSETTRLDSTFRIMMRDLRATFVICYVVFIIVYIGTIYTTYIMPGVDFTYVLPIFRPGLAAVKSFLSGNYLILVNFVAVNAVVLFLFVYFQVGDILLLTVKTTRDILLFFESLKFLTTLDLMQDMENGTEFTLFNKTIDSLEINPLKDFLRKKLKEVEDSPDLTQSFLTATTFLDESDVAHLVDVNTYTNRSNFAVNVTTLVAQKQFEASSRESTDAEKIGLFKAAMLNFVYAAGMVMFFIGDLQIFNTII